MRFTVDQIVLQEVHLPLVHFFETSLGRVDERHVILVEVRCGDLAGWGECVAEEAPFYSCETVETAWSILTRFIVPRLLRRSLESPTEVPQLLEHIRGHAMAKACVEAALWDLQAQLQGVPLWRLLGGTRERIACGVSIGIQDHPDMLLQKIETELEAGYHKIKIKIKPGWDVEIVRLVRRHFSDIPLMVDANSAYTLADAAHLKRLDEFNLLMMEQPLRYDDLAEHSRLQAQMGTPICLDESIRHANDAIHACELGACRIINIKMGRVGGPTEARRVHDVCRQRGVPVWCGGMLETGIGRAHNIALSTLENFSIPGDVSAGKRYYERDTIRPPVEVSADGYITAPDRPGLGYQVDRERIERISIRRETFS